LDEDAYIMNNIGKNLPSGVKYVVVLTKADKNVKGASTKNSGRVSDSIMENLKKCMDENNVSKAPIVLTSSETKLGRYEMWRYMRLAAEVI
jgi:GTP-binding protein EngB required for normal cell division